MFFPNELTCSGRLILCTSHTSQSSCLFFLSPLCTMNHSNTVFTLIYIYSIIYIYIVTRYSGPPREYRFGFCFSVAFFSFVHQPIHTLDVFSLFLTNGNIRYVNCYRDTTVLSKRHSEWKWWTPPGDEHTYIDYYYFFFRILYERFCICNHRPCNSFHRVISKRSVLIMSCIFFFLVKSKPIELCLRNARYWPRSIVRTLRRPFEPA